MIHCGAVYFARGATSGLYKIGYSENLRRRGGSLVAEAREPIEMLAAIPSRRSLKMPCRIDEREMLARFARLRAGVPGRSNEWFADDGSIAAFIASLPPYQRGSYLIRPRGKSKRGPSHPPLPAFIARANKLPHAEVA